MSDLQIIQARRKAIEMQRVELDREDADLAIAERVLTSLLRPNKPLLTQTAPQQPALAYSSGLPLPATGQQATAFAFLPEDGSRMERALFRQCIDATRSEPLTDNGFATLLSRMGTAHLIHRDATHVWRANMPPDRQVSQIQLLDSDNDEGEADVSLNGTS